MRKMIEGSRAVAEAVGLCRPQVIAAYPITPQTHIVEELSQLVADGEIRAEYVRVESEHSAASVCLGAAASGARTYSATTSQGLLLMTEVMYNIAGMRLPVVITGVNRAVSAPLNIWNDQQDTLSLRDAGWIQLYAEDNQEALDLHLQAYRIGEDYRVLLPVLVCMDGFILTHTYEPVEMPSQEEADAYLPPFDPLFKLDPANPVTLGSFVGPEAYQEVRYLLHQSMLGAKEVIREAAQEFRQAFGRWQGDLLDTYRLDDAETAFVSMGSVLGTMKEAVDLLRERGERVGIIKVRCFRPFPGEELRELVKGLKRAIVVEKAVSMGGQGILAADLRSACYGLPDTEIFGVVAGLGGRDITPETIDDIYARAQRGEARDFFAGLDQRLLEGAYADAGS